MQRKGKAVGTALAKTTPQGYMPAPVMVYLKKSISCLVCFMGAMYSANPYVPTAYDMPANRIQKIVDSLQGRGHIITDAQGMETLKTMNIPESMSIHIYEEIVETETDGELIEKTLNSVIDTRPYLYNVHIWFDRCTERRYSAAQRRYRLCNLGCKDI